MITVVDIVVPKKKKKKKRRRGGKEKSYLPVKGSFQIQLTNGNFQIRFQGLGIILSGLGILLLGSWFHHASFSFFPMKCSSCLQLSSFFSLLLAREFWESHSLLFPITFVPFSPNWQCFCWNNFLKKFSYWFYSSWWKPYLQYFQDNRFLVLGTGEMTEGEPPKLPKGPLLWLKHNFSLSKGPSAWLKTLTFHHSEIYSFISWSGCLRFGAIMNKYLITHVGMFSILSSTYLGVELLGNREKKTW